MANNLLIFRKEPLVGDHRRVSATRRTPSHTLPLLLLISKSFHCQQGPRSDSQKGTLKRTRKIFSLWTFHLPSTQPVSSCLLYSSELLIFIQHNQFSLLVRFFYWTAHLPQTNYPWSYSSLQVSFEVDAVRASEGEWHRNEKRRGGCPSKFKTTLGMSALKLVTTECGLLKCFCVVLWETV